MESKTYTLVLSDAERKMLVFCMGGIVPNIRHETIKFLPPEEFHSLALRLMDAQPDRAPANAISGTDQARAILSPPAPASTQHAPIEPRERWARDRKGKEVPNPAGCISQEVRICKVEQKPPRSAGKAAYWKVTWESPTGSGFVDANCFDDALAPWLITVQGKRATLFTLTSGAYLNVVGVRA